MALADAAVRADLAARVSPAKPVEARGAAAAVAEAAQLVAVAASRGWVELEATLRPAQERMADLQAAELAAAPGPLALLAPPAPRTRRLAFRRVR